MTAKDRARQIVLEHVNAFREITFEERLQEIALVTNSDAYLLEHINAILEVMEAAKKEIENGLDIIDFDTTSISDEDRKKISDGAIRALKTIGEKDE